TKRAHHIERAMREIDDVEHAEDDGKPEAEQRVERAVDQSHQKLCIESCHRSFSRAVFCSTSHRRYLRAGGKRHHFFSKGQVLLSSGVKASFAGMVATSL